MIAYLFGQIRDIRSGHITLVVNGIGFDLQIPQSYQFQIGSQVAFEVYTHSNQEQGAQLFGFNTVDERHIFTLVISCSGVGPKIGLAVLSSLTPALFISAVMTGDIKTLSSIDGIGRKKAESMIMQLKDKVAKFALSGTEQVSHSAQSVKQVSDVLDSLGYTRQEVTGALERLRGDGMLDVSFDEMLRKSLGYLAKRF